MSGHGVIGDIIIKDINNGREYQIFVVLHFTLYTLLISSYVALINSNCVK